MVSFSHDPRRRGEQRWPLAASTLGTPTESVAEVIACLEPTGTRWVELRTGPGQLAEVAASSGQRSRLREQLAAAGIGVLALASYVRIGAPGSDDEVITDLVDHLRLAADLGARHVRVFPGGGDLPTAVDPTTDARMVRRLAAAVPVGDQLRVTPLLETHDSHSRGRDVGRVLDALGNTVSGHRVGAIWDVHHPLRAGEAPDTTATLLAPHLLGGRGYMQIKDVRSATEVTPSAPGEGCLPLARIFEAASRIGYRGPVSLEWERAWHPEIERLGRPLAVTAAWLQQHRDQADAASGAT